MDQNDPDITNSNNAATSTCLKRKENSINNGALTSSADNSQWSEFCDESVLNQLDEPFGILLNGSQLRSDEKYTGFDNNVGDTWIYPMDLPIRNYQFNITRVALFRNTLVVLPTGLGKTFIAAVVMFNIYRWYPLGKVIFMAPTRPLVTQQIDACRKIMGIPLEDIAEMTGKQNKKSRCELWKTKRIFFATPQVVQSDIHDNEQNFPFNDIKLLVIDEAHKAKGRYAYCEVVQSIISRNPYYRILALSATPGRRIDDVVEIIKNLYISNVELRWENSIDIVPYTHKKNVKTIVISIGNELTKIKNEFIDLIDPYIRNLYDNGVLSSASHNLSRNVLIMEQKRFRDTSIRHKHPNHGQVATDFSICISLYHALELLERHGVRVFLNFFDDNDAPLFNNSHNQDDANLSTSFDGNEKGSSTSTTNIQWGQKKRNEKFFVAMNPKLREFLENLRKKIGPNPFTFNDQTMTNGQIPKIPKDLDFGHPKYEMAKKYLVEHFEKANDSRAIIFCEYRESVLLIHRLLLQCRPLIIPRIFVGQGGVGSIRAVTQKQQIQIMSDFRNGICNTLIATSVAEEGIDVGDVDLIICFDISTKNPMRLIQRIGRTGRKRQGNVIILVTEGKEHAMIKEVLATKDKTNQKIAKSREIQQILYKQSPRIVPPEFDPRCIQLYMQVPEEIEQVKTTKNIKKTGNTKGNKRKSTEMENNDNQNENDDEVEPKSKKSRTKHLKKTKLSPKGCKDVRTFFKKTQFNEEEEKEIFEDTKVKLYEKQGKTSTNDNIITTMDKKDNNIEIDEPLVADVSFMKTKYQGVIRKMKNFIRRLDNNNTFETESINIPLEALKSKILSKKAKKLYLSRNYEYVKEKFEAIQAVEAVYADADEIDTDIIILREEFNLIEAIFEGRNNIQKFLEQKNENNCKNKLQELDEKYSDLFLGYEKRDIFDDINVFVDKKIQEIELKRKNQIEEESSDDDNDEFVAIEKSLHQNNTVDKSKIAAFLMKDEEKDFEEESFLNGFEMDEIESKYSDQWTQFKNNNNQMKMQSTPLRNNNSNKQGFFIENKICMPGKSSRIKSPIMENNSFDLHGFSSAADCFVNETENFINENFFDDDFDEIIATSSSILNEVSKSNENSINNQKNKPIVLDESKQSTKEVESTSIKESQCSKITKEHVSDLVTSATKWKITAEKENIPEKSKVTSTSFENSSEIEDFDLNDFIEPFDLEDQEIPHDNENKEPILLGNSKTTRHQFHYCCKSITNDTKDLSMNSVNNSRKTSILNYLNQDFAEKNKQKITQPIVKIDASPSVVLKVNDKSIAAPTEVPPPPPPPPPKSMNTSPSVFKRPRLNFSKLKLYNSEDKSSENVKKISPQSSVITEKSSVSSPISSQNNYDMDQSIIARPFICRKKRTIESSESSTDSDLEIIEDKTPPGRKPRLQIYKKVKRRRCNFFDDQAKCSDSSGDESGDELPQSLISIIDDDVQPTITTNMRAKYLQSIRSPRVNVNGYRIPVNRNYAPLSQICSQPFVEESANAYKEDSFVISDDDEAENDIDVDETCLLERAEAILEAKRKEKRTNNLGNNRKTRIIKGFNDSSDDER